MGDRVEKNPRIANILGRAILTAAALVPGIAGGAEAAGTSGHATGQTITGDVNCDGKTNSIDAALILQENAGLINNLACSQAGDFNSDGRINSIDASLVLQYDAGLIELPAKPTATNTPTITPTRIPTRTPTEAPTATSTPEPTPAFQEGPNYELAQGITELINQERQELGINQLTLNSALVSAANEYAKFLFDNPSLGFGHNLDGLDPGQRAQKYGYQGGWVGEILETRGYKDAIYFTPEIFMQGWLDSPPHYSNIIDPKYRYIGVGCYQGSDQLPTAKIILNICVGNFGRLP